jgi:hypothetical protein
MHIMQKLQYLSALVLNTRHTGQHFAH